MFSMHYVRHPKFTFVLANLTLTVAAVHIAFYEPQNAPISSPEVRLLSLPNTWCAELDAYLYRVEGQSLIPILTLYSLHPQNK